MFNTTFNAYLLHLPLFLEEALNQLRRYRDPEVYLVSVLVRQGLIRSAADISEAECKLMELILLVVKGRRTLDEVLPALQEQYVAIFDISCRRLRDNLLLIVQGKRQLQ